jgi:hypothetical protein
MQRPEPRAPSRAPGDLAGGSTKTRRDTLMLSLLVAASGMLAAVGIGHQLASAGEPDSQRNRRLALLIEQLQQDSARCTSTSAQASQDN